MRTFSLQKTAFYTLLIAGLSMFAFCAALPVNAQDYSDYSDSDDTYTAQELDSLLAPVALYPDPLLAQIFPAATFPDQLDEAARLLRAGIDPNAIDAQPWDISVKAVAHYPTILYMMADRLDWTQDLGNAYANQAQDVMDSVQRLRGEALAAGNLQSTPQQQIVQDENGIEIWPAQPQTVYVPSYDPDAVYTTGYWEGPAISFGIGFGIGGWLDNDFDWHHRRVYHHGWEENHGWVARSRPFIHDQQARRSEANQNVTINPASVHHGSTSGGLGNWQHHNQGATTQSVTRNTGVNNSAVVAGGTAAGTTTGGTHHHFQSGATTATLTPSGTPTNKIIQRNINTSDPRLENFRGRQAVTNAQQQQQAQQQAQIHTQQVQQAQQQQQIQRQQEQVRIQAQQQAQQAQQQAEMRAREAQLQAQTRAHEAQQQAENRAHEAQQQALRQQQQQQAQQQARMLAEQQAAQQQAQIRAQQQQAQQHAAQMNAFQQSHSGFNPHQESQRGQASRNIAQGKGQGQEQHNANDDKGKHQ